MVVGFNHNIRYRGEVFHVQTEDSGLANPHIITLLYRGGTILASAKTSYADIIKTEQLELVVESIMKEQHKQMMRRLKDGEFDARIFPEGAVPKPADAPPVTEAVPPKEPAAAVQPPMQTKPQLQSAGDAPRPMPAAAKSPSPVSPSPAKRSLDEVILDYLITGEEK